MFKLMFAKFTIRNAIHNIKLIRSAKYNDKIKIPFYYDIYMSDLVTIRIDDFSIQVFRSGEFMGEIVTIKLNGFLIYSYGFTSEAKYIDKEFLHLYLKAIEKIKKFNKTVDNIYADIHAEANRIDVEREAKGRLVKENRKQELINKYIKN